MKSLEILHFTRGQYTTKCHQRSNEYLRMLLTIQCLVSVTALF